MTIVEILHERQQVYAQIHDLRGQRDKNNGKFTDGATETTFQNLQSRWMELDKMRAQAELDDATDKAMVAAIAADDAQKRTEKKSDWTSDITYDRAFANWLTREHGAPIPEDEKRMLETRGTSTQIGSTDSLGGYTVPQQFSNELETMMKWYGGMLATCGIMPDTVGGTLKYPSVDDTAISGAVISQGTQTTVSDLTFGNVLFGDYAIDSKIVKLSLELMNDNRVNLVNTILTDVLGNRLGRAVNTKLTNGTGTNEPYGLTTTVTNSALTTAGATAITEAELIKVIHSVDRAYRYGPSCGFMMSDTIMGYLRTLDIGNTNTVRIFYPALVAGEPDKLAGYPIFINNDLQAANASTKVPVTGTKSLYFGDFSKYKIRRIGGINMSRNDMLYWDSRAVGFMGWLRLDGNLINANAIKYLLQA